jgi:LPS export ABC transporter permease LptG
MRIIDKYIMREVGLFVLVGIFGFTILIIGNNFYALSDLIFQKKVAFSDLLMITLLDTPATMVLSLPVATLFGVMLSIGRLAMDSELVAMRTGGISLTRILMPLLVISLFFSGLTYYMGEKLVPIASETSKLIKEEKIKGKQYHLKNNIFFKRSDEFIIAVNTYNAEDKSLTRPVIWYRDDTGDIHIYTAFAGKFEGDELLLAEVNHHVFDGKDKYHNLKYIEKLETLKLPFPEVLQEVHSDDAGASGLAASDLRGQISNLEQSGQDPSVARTNLAFKYATPIACTIFSFVAFMFSVLNPRKERYSGVFMALVLIFIYYISQTVFKSLGEKGVVSPPELAAWATNLIFLTIGIVTFSKTSK